MRRLVDVYPGSAHVKDFGLERADDEAIWAHAAGAEFMLTSKDDDFLARSLLRGAPPKVIWVRLGNCTTTDVETLLRSRYDDVAAFAADATAAVLALSRQR